MSSAAAVWCDDRLKPAAAPRLMFALKSEVDRTANDSDPIEQRAIAAVKSGDSGSYDYVVSKYMKRVVSIAWGIVRNAHDAEDLAQEAFVKAFQTIERFKAGEPFGPWIYRIVTNLALDVMKHRQRFRHEEIQDSLPATRGDRADLPAVVNELARRIDQAIEALPEMQRIVARLYLVEHFEHSEIAAMTSLTEGTVMSHLSLARAKLRERLADLYEGRHE
jgi:RNA polymerase sigma-70 factor (ECF subfamily)